MVIYIHVAGLSRNEPEVLSFFYDYSTIIHLKDAPRRIGAKMESVTKNAESAEKIMEKYGFFLKKMGTGCIVIDSDVVYPEYDVRKVPGSGSSGTPFFLLFVDTN